ncbi:tRNA 2-selenouridine(34) synthase MnmH [Microbulbifer sp. OS29]|uniref:tRNA 2-selenouridine(34) synthase MnmH n=1 Tax=Microbulbifer okhotskensis TaxID=2926617 RepID=A0A9X2ERY1_9GAMM|nr:tRNA 2-selenouridine(34) synthase MnmH [Microbulbifer okhotskensis]MCO1334626.1 tRNA 2-selenouridine(34) synthase MnmH [Microbulbifer okhotskensis]
MDTANFTDLFLNDTPLMDVRAPVEFIHGAFPSAENHPLLDDRQRELIGTEYKRNGQQAAIELGWQLATDEVLHSCLTQWGEFTDKYPQGYLYCFRGGLRSQTTQKLLRTEGIDYPMVQGGYKAMRHFLITELQTQCNNLPFVVIAGHTGSGKTELIQVAGRAIDLEGIAKHRGSSFGRTASNQPAQIDFENQLSINLLKLAQQPGTVIVEDESRLIGRCALPVALQTTMKNAPRVIVEEPLETRAQRIVRDYISEGLKRFVTAEKPATLALGEELRLNLSRIQKRLGGLRYKQLDDQLALANRELQTQNNSDVYIPLVISLLRDYYDGTYDHLMKKFEQKILFRGSYHEVQQWLERSSQSLNEI